MMTLYYVNMAILNSIISVFGLWTDLSASVLFFVLRWNRQGLKFYEKVWMVKFVITGEL